MGILSSEACKKSPARRAARENETGHRNPRHPSDHATPDDGRPLICGEYFGGRGRPRRFLSSKVPTEQTPEAFGCMLNMYCAARIYTVNLENQASANLRARAHFRSVVGTAAAVIDVNTSRPGIEEFPPAGRDLQCSVPRPSGSTITLRAKVEGQSRVSSLRRTSMHNGRALVSYRKLLDFSTLVIYLIVGGMMIGSGVAQLLTPPPR